MSKRLTGDDVSMLNEFIISSDQNLAKIGRDKLAEFINRPGSFADSIAEDWAHRIYKRITRSGSQHASGSTCGKFA